jgi:redox-sensitive bicupin YhaK (pirin superfamily)
MKLTTVFAVGGLTLGLALGAAAQDKTPVVKQREINQQKRIEQGVKSGELTRGETARLERQQAKIKTDKLMAKADGKVTPKERAKLQREQNRASRAIYKAKHNAQVQK